MNKYSDVILQAINAGMNGDIEALWVAKLLLTADIALRADNGQGQPKTVN